MVGLTESGSGWPDWMIPVVVAVVGSGALSALVTGLLRRSKTDAEAHSIQISGDLSIGKSAMEFAEQLKQHAADLQTRMDESENRWVAKFQLLREENRTLRDELQAVRTTHITREKELQGEIDTLKDKVELLEEQLSEREQIIDCLRGRLAKYEDDGGEARQT